MKKMMSIAAVTLFVIGMTGCCCFKGKSCSADCTKPCCEKPAE